MARRYLGYGITNSSGVAKLEYLYNSTTGQNSSSASAHSYTGVGAGELDIVAESGTLQSETYGILDCSVYDSMSSDTTANYYFNTADGNSVTFNNGFVFVAGTGNRYFQYGTTSSGITTDLDRFKGHRLKMECDVTAITGRVRLSLWEYGNGSFTQQPSSAYISDTASSPLSVSLPNAVSDSCTRIYVRIQLENANDTVTIKNLKVYPI